MLRYPATTKTRRPLIVALHGYDQRAADFDAYTRISAVGAGLGAIVAVPQGLGNPAGWNVPDDPSLGPSDVTFLRALIQQLVTHGCVNPARVVIAGLSDGSDMAVTAGCALGPRVVRGVLLVAASTGPSPRCRALAVRQIHGTTDPIDAYTGRAADTRRGFGSVKAAGAEQAFAEWSRLARCTGHTSILRGDLRTFTGVHCRKPVVLIAVQGGGHTWPGAAPRPALGRTTDSLDTRGLLSAVLAK